MELEIRQVKPGDVALFDRVAEAVFDEPVDPSRLAAYLAQPGHHMLVALRAGEVVAQVAAVIHRHPDKATELYIDEVGVTPALQRQGIARAMLDQMFELGRALGCEEAWVGTETDNRRHAGSTNPVAPQPSLLSCICSNCECASVHAPNTPRRGAAKVRVMTGSRCRAFRRLASRDQASSPWLGTDCNEDQRRDVVASAGFCSASAFRLASPVSKSLPIMLSMLKKTLMIFAT